MKAFDEEELGVFSSRLVVHDRMPVLQFLTGGEEHSDECIFVHLGHLLEWDTSLSVLVDLPKGWKAWRWSRDDEFVREPIPADQPQVED